MTTLSVLTTTLTDMLGPHVAGFAAIGIQAGHVPLAASNLPFLPDDSALWAVRASYLERLVLIYFVIINLIAFATYGFDKWRARRSKRRVSEYSLLSLSFMGGWLGATLAMRKFRHKTQKRRFFWLNLCFATLWITAASVWTFYRLKA